MVGLHLRLIGTSDVHANILPYDYYRDRPDDTVGLARTAALIAAARAEEPNALLFDNGDFLQGAPLADWAAAALRKDPKTVHPMIAAMNALSYDAGALGNHEFNYGLDVLDAAIAAAKFPILSCNIFRPDGGFRFTPYVALKRRFRDEDGAPRDLFLGVIGFTTPQITQWDQSELFGRATTIGIAEAARRYVPELRRQGADLVVALCHSGISRVLPSPGEENAAVALAEVGGLDAIVTGHQHLRLPGEDFFGAPEVEARQGRLAGTPAFMPGFFGSDLGIIDFRLVPSGSGWRVDEAQVVLRPIYEREGETVRPRVATDPALAALAAPAHRATLAYVRAPVGELKAPVHSYFALIADDASVEIVNTAQLWYVNRLVPHVSALQGAPILSATAPFKCGGRGGPDYYTLVEAGPIAIKNVADLYVYPNGLRVLRASGAIVREWLERSASLFNRVDPENAKPQPLVGKSVACYDFDVIDGVTYAIDVTEPARYDDRGAVVAPAARRIVDLRFRGAPIDPAAEFLIVTNSYRAGGGGSFPGCDGSTVVFEAPDGNRDALRRYIAETGHVDPRPHIAWRLAPWPAHLVVTYATSPAATSVPAPAGLKLTLIGPGEGGFAEFRVEFE